MGDNSAIEWTGATWNPLVAFIADPKGKYTFDDAPGLKWRRGWFCVHASEGCRHCYAEKMNLWRGNGLTYKAQNLPLVRFELVNLIQPFKWSKPRRIFPCSMTDLFADLYTDEQIDMVFKVMALTPDHTYQVLTKRARRMFEYVTGLYKRRGDFIDRATHDGAQLLITAFEGGLQNVWLGVSVEEHKTADARIPFLLKTPAAVRWLSCEPLLGPLDLSPYLASGYAEPPYDDIVSWVVCGGESGAKARPMHPQWARSLRDQCVAAGVPFFFKQWGEWGPTDYMGRGTHWAYGKGRFANWIGGRDEWHESTVPGGSTVLARVGKKEAGRMLDGRTWDQYPA